MTSPQKLARPLPFIALVALLSSTALPACAQVVPPPAATGYAVGEAPDYADSAELVIASPLVIDATIRSATRIKGAEAATVPPGTIRFYVEADVLGLVRGPGAIPPRIGYLLDSPLDPNGRAPKYRKSRVLLFARPVAGRPDQVQLVTPSAQRGWTQAADAQARAIVQELVSADTPPDITGVGNAFHVPGSLPGEGETQVFLTTADRRPVSLSILRRPGEQPRWAVALSEIVDDSAAPPRRDTLLWYRLACGLPRDLPDRNTTALAPEDAAKAREDYAFVLEQLGPCGRGGETSLVEADR